MNEEKNTIGVEKMELIKNRKGKWKNHPCSSKLKMKRRGECNVMLNVNGGKPFPIQMSK
jgi:hypothetical protein